MTRQFLKLLTVSLLIISCEKSDFYIDPDYPTTFKKLPDEEISQMRTSLTNDYPFIRSTLNEFGFCYPSDYYEVIDPPPISHLLTEAESIELAREFILKHPSETSIENLGDLNISRVYSLSEGIHWVVVSSIQKVDTIEVLYADIVFRFKNGELVNCEGNWFPNIYIPDKFNFSESKAKTNIIGKQVTHYGMGGEEYFQTISRSALENSTTDLKIVPIKSADKIELRVAWMIYIPAVSCEVYVDVMTGQIIKQASTLIS